MCTYEKYGLNCHLKVKNFLLYVYSCNLLEVLDDIHFVKLALIWMILWFLLNLKLVKMILIHGSISNMKKCLNLRLENQLHIKDITVVHCEIGVLYISHVRLDRTVCVLMSLGLKLHNEHYLNQLYFVGDLHKIFQHSLGRHLCQRLKQ